MATWWWLCVCSLGILLLAPCSLSEKFSLAGSPRPVVGVVGQDVVLPCQLSPPTRLPSMEVLWRKIGTVFITVHKYSDESSQDLPGDGYQTRTELFPQEFSSGNVSLKLKRLQGADAGTYHCFVRNPEWSQEATTELRVAAVAPVSIDVLGPRGQGIGLACRSTGWFPKPELRWVGKNWQNLSMEIVTNVTQDRENLYSVVSHVTVKEGEDNGDISCIVRNGLLGTEQQSAIHLSAKRKVSQKKRSKEERLLNLETEKNTRETECQELHEKLEAQRKAFESDLKVQNEKIETEERKNKELESECDKLRRTIETEKDKNTRLESDLKVQRQKMVSEERKYKELESECGQLSRTIETEKDKNMQLESDLKVQRQKMETEKREKKELESECDKLRLAIKTEKNKNMRLESELKVKIQKIETEEKKKKQLESAYQDLHEKFDKAVTQLDFMRAQSYMVPVTLDPDSSTPSSPSLRMAEESNMTLPP